MWKMTFAGILLLVGANGCANGPVEPAPTIQTECLWVEIIRPTQGDVDVISQGLVDQILRHNRLVEEHCESEESATAARASVWSNPAILGQGKSDQASPRRA